ncbi:MAG: Crp/Fnr family transcriptional regulator [Acidobacteriota bacterium]
MNFDSAAFVADPPLVEALRERAVPVDCSHDQVLFRQGEAAHGLYLLLSGDATLRLESPMGDDIVFMPAMPGSLLGLPGLIGNLAYSMSCEAKQGAEICYLSRDEFSKLMMNEPPLAMMMLRVLAAEVRTARSAMANPEGVIPAS